MKLTVKQTRALDFLEDVGTTEVLYGGAAGGGKSVLGCYWVLKNCLKYPGSRWLIGRSELKNLKKTTLNSFFEVAAFQGLKAGVHYRYNQQDSIISFPNKSQIILADLFLYPSDPEFDSLGSLEITGAFIDECNQLVEKAKNIVKSRIRYKLNEFGMKPKMLMTCNPGKNWVYYEFYLKNLHKELEDHKRFIQALPGDNPHLPDSYLSNLQSLDKNSRERLLNGNWEYDDDPAALIEYEKIIGVFGKEVKNGGYYLTCDVARFGKDTTVIGIWDGFNVSLFQYVGKSVTEVAEIVRGYQVKYSIRPDKTIVDEDGVGGGVVDILKCKGFINNATPLPNPDKPEIDEKGNMKPENYKNLKSQCYFRLAKRINDGELAVNCNQSLKHLIIQELEQVKQDKMDQDGKRQVLAKDKVKEIIGRSPDFSDTLMMREYFELAPRFVVAVA